MEEHEPSRAINPYSIFRRIWEYFMFFISAIVLFELPFEWIFDIPLNYKWIIPSLVLDVFFAIDIYISQNTGILEFGVVSLNKKYIHSKITVLGKIVYWITPIPFYLIGYFIKSVKVYRILISLKLLRLVRLGKAIHLMQTSLIYVGPFSKMLILLIFLLVIDHVFSCIFWLVGNRELPGPSWLHEVALIDTEPQLVQYIHTFYYITTTMLTIGYGDLHPYTFTEIIIIIVVECVGVFFYNFFLSNMVSIVADPSRTSFLEKYQKIYIAFKWRGVSNDSILELLRYFEYVWERDHDESVFYENAQKMPESLKKKVALALHAQLFEKIDSLKDLSQETLGQIAMRLRPRIFTPGDYLIKARSVSKKIFFLSSGKVQVLSSCGSLINSHEGPAGIVFGIGSFLNGSEEVTCVIAQTYVETYELTKGDFDDLKESNEDFRSAMRRKAGPIQISSRLDYLNRGGSPSPRNDRIQHNMSVISQMPPLGDISLLHSNTPNLHSPKGRRATTTITTTLPAYPPAHSDENSTPIPSLTLENPAKEENVPVVTSPSNPKLLNQISSLATMTTNNNNQRSSILADPQLSLRQAEDNGPRILNASNSTINLNNNRKSIRLADLSQLGSSPLLSQNTGTLAKKSAFEAPQPHVPLFPTPRPTAKEMPVRYVPSLRPISRNSLEQLQLKSHQSLNLPASKPTPNTADSKDRPPTPASPKPTDNDVVAPSPSTNTNLPPLPPSAAPLPPHIPQSVSHPEIPPHIPLVSHFEPPSPPHIPSSITPTELPPSPHIPASILPEVHPETVVPAQNLPPLIPSEPPTIEDSLKTSSHSINLPQHEEKKSDSSQKQFEMKMSPQLQQQMPNYSIAGNLMKPKQKRIMISDMLNSRKNQNEPAQDLPPPPKPHYHQTKSKKSHKHHRNHDDDDSDESLDSDVDAESHPPV